MNQAQKRTGTKKVLSMILVLVMLLSLLSMAAFTLPASETASSGNSYDYNIMFLDCGRKYFSVDSIEKIIDNASAAGFNYIQLAVGNDGLRFLLDNMSLTVNGTTYTSEQVSSAIHTGNEAYYNFDVDELTETEMDTIIAYAASKGMGVIPCVNTPGHMDAILSAANSLTGTTCSYNGSVRTIDVTNDTAVAFTQALLQKYITYFAGKGCKLFNMGADEYANDIYTGGSMGFGNLQDTGKYSYYVTYVNQVAKMIKAVGMTPMAFNDGIYFNKNTSSGTFDTDIIICYWSSGWDGYSPMPASELAKKDFKLINTNGSYYWVVGKSDAQCDDTKASGFNKNSFPDKNSFSGNSIISNPAGSMFCIWADYPGAESEADVISKTADTITAFGKALPQVGIKSSGGTALTLNGSTELTVPGNAEATWSVDPAGVIELQSSSNADDKSAITGKSVIAKAVGVGTAKVTATVDDKTTYTTTLTVTDPSTVDVTVAVNGTKTITVPGTYNGSYTTGDTSIATVTTEATPTERKLTPVTSIESGKQYLIVNNRRSEDDGNLLTAQTSTWYGNSGLKLTGEASITSTELWTIQESGSGYEVMRGSNYLTIGENTAYVQSSSAVLTLRYNTSGGYWNISQNSCYLNNLGNSETAGGWKWANNNNAPTDGGSQWTIYEITGGGEQTTITFTGKSVGDTSVQIGDVTYKIHVVAEDLSNVTPLTIEYWITNGRVKSDANSSTTEASISATDNGIATETGKNVSELVPSKGIKVGGGREVDYWRCRMLNTKLENSSTSGTEQQTEASGDDETVSGIGFTKIRYYDGNWQVFTENNAWVTVDTVKKQLVAYYLENIKVSDEVDSFAADWGNRGDGTKGGWLDENNYCTLSMQVVYEDGTTNPTGTAADDLKTKTIVYGYWNNNNGRGIGTVLLEGQEYEIYKVTSETGAAAASISSSGSDTYSAEVTKFTWDKNEKTVWQGEPSSSVSIHNNANKFSSDGVNANLCWDENKEAILLRVYVRAKVTEDSLTVNYYDESDLSKPFYDYNISVKKGTEFDKGFARTDDGKLVNNTVTNIKNVQQTVQWNLSQLKQIDAQYRYSDYEFTRAERSADGKTVNLYYKFKSSKTFVVDFGLPMMIRPADMNANLGNKEVSLTKVDITQSTTYANISVDSNKNITYTLNKTIDGKDNFGAAYSGTIPKYDESGNLTGVQEGTVKYSITIIPATSVYYEDSFVKFSDGWTQAGTTEENAVQNLDELGKTGANNYGYDAQYNNSSTYSLGSAMKTTVSSATNSTPPTATFTFKGTGFDLVSMTSKDTGTILVDVIGTTENNKTVTKHWIVDTFYGYTRKLDGYIQYTWKLDKDGKTWHNTAEKIPALPEGAETGGKPEDGVTYEPNYIWTPAGEGDNALYQIPVIHYTDLPYGEYTVTVTPKYSSSRDPYYQANGNNNSYDFYLDGVRIYNPAGDKLNSQYVKDGEGYAQFTEIRNMLLSTSGLTANIQPTTGMVFVDGVGDKGEIADYTNYGPNNEVYLARNQAIAFKISDMNNVDSIQIGAKAPNGNATMQIKVGSSDVQTKELQTASDMYYKLDNVQANQTIVITNTSDSLLSLTTLKVTYKNEPSASNSADPVVDEEVVAQAPVMLMSMLYGEPQTFEPDHFTAKWSRNVRKGGTATLTVKASADVESITVDGQPITTYTTKTARSVWGAKETYHVFTYQVKNAATATYSICAVNGDGVASDPITAKLTVRPSIRDWWNGIFDKWKH